MTDLAGFWAAVLSHLWQSALALGLLGLLARGLRSAPSRVEHSLWTVGLAKLLVPLSIGGALAERVLRESAGAVSAAAAVVPETWIAPGRALAPAMAGAGARPWLIALTLLWAAGFTFGLVRIARQLRAAGRILRDSRVPTARERARLAAALLDSRADARRIRVTSSTVGPSVIGTLRPTIVVPERVVTDLSAAELRGVLEHEEAHRLRFDPARTLARRIVAAAFFFFPPVALLLRRLHETAEYACDERCLRSVDPGVYVRALARVTRLGLGAAPTPAAVGDARGSLLVRRLRRIERSRRYSVKPIHRLAMIAAGLAVLTTSFSPRAGAEDAAAAAAEFDEAPKILGLVQPEYPEPAKSDRAEGTVILRVDVSADGAPGEIVVLQEVEGHPELARAAVAAVEQWTFTPAKKDGEAVPARVQIPLRFELSPVELGPAQEKPGPVGDDC